MRALAGTLGIAVLLALSAVALQRGWADILAFQGRGVIRTAEKQRRAPSEEARALGHERLRAAHALDPANPGIAEDIARLQEPRDPGLALEYLRQSARARPGSPYTWANIAHVKSRLGQRDEEFTHAIRQAAAFGPWEPEVQILLAEVGLREWDRLPETTREMLRAAFAKGLKRQDKKLFELALAHSRLDVLCALPEVRRSRQALRCI